MGQDTTPFRRALLSNTNGQVSVTTGEVARLDFKQARHAVTAHDDNLASIVKMQDYSKSTGVKEYYLTIRKDCNPAEAMAMFNESGLFGTAEGPSYGSMFVEAAMPTVDEMVHATHTQPVDHKLTAKALKKKQQAELLRNS
tara:strand:+ start:223 stop:645 length:423 start_codon:yes stop_codon:yes gene_type:complete